MEKITIWTSALQYVKRLDVTATNEMLCLCLQYEGNEVQQSWFEASGKSGCTQNLGDMCPSFSHSTTYHTAN